MPCGLAGGFAPRVSDFDPQRLLAALEGSGADYVVVGGIALMAHGVVRATLDLDIVPDPSTENIGRLATALAEIGAQPQGEPQTPVDAGLLGRAANMRFDTGAGPLDVLCADQYRRLYPDLRERSVAIEVAGVVARVVSRNDLIRMKAGTGRDRDLLDIGDLLALEE